MEKSGTCRNCKIITRGILHLRIKQSGAECFVWVCSRCNAQAPFGGEMEIAKAKVQAHLNAEQIAQLPVIMPDASNRCVKCGERTCEMHHWAPKAIFGKDECEQWPKDYLCLKCHDLWHKLVTPQFFTK